MDRPKGQRDARKKALSGRGGSQGWVQDRVQSRAGSGEIHSLGESRAGSEAQREGRQGWQGWRVEG